MQQNRNSNGNLTVIEQWFRKIFTAQNIGIVLAAISAAVAVITLMIEHREIFQTETPDSVLQTEVASVIEKQPAPVAPKASSPEAEAPQKVQQEVPQAVQQAPAKTTVAQPAPATVPTPKAAPAPAPAPAPVRIDYSFNNPDVTFTFKKCVCAGGNAYIDLVIANNSGSHLSASVLSQEPCAGYEDWKCVAYDDQGNSYPVARLKAGGSDRSIGSNYPLELPDGVPVKARIWFSGVAKDASEFSLLKLSFRGMDTAEPYGAGLLQMKKIPIARP